MINDAQLSGVAQVVVVSIVVVVAAPMLLLHLYFWYIFHFILEKDVGEKVHTSSRSKSRNNHNKDMRQKGLQSCQSCQAQKINKHKQRSNVGDCDIPATYLTKSIS